MEVSLYLVDLWLDGYTDENARAKACDFFVEDQLNITASSVRVHRIDGMDFEKAVKIIKESHGNIQS